MPPRKTPPKETPTPPGEDVLRKMDEAHTEDEFLADLDKATTDEARHRLGLPSAPAQGSTKT
jgi:hypothetical protein